MANSLSRNERLYLQDQTDPLAVPNTAGASTLAVANYCPHVRFRTVPNNALLFSRSKTGTRTARRGIGGRKFVNWSAAIEMIGAASAIAPPSSPLWRGLFGSSASVIAGSGSVTGATNASPIVITQLGHGKVDGDVVRIASVGGNTAANGVWVINQLTVDTYELVGSTGNGAYTTGGTASFVGVKYTLTDDILPFVAGLFRTPSTLQQRLAYGCVATNATIQLGQDVAEAEFSGEGIYELDSDTFSSETAELQAGLTAFPVEPAGTLPSDSGIVAGFTGRAVINGSAFSGIRTATLSIGTANEVVKNNFGRFTPDETEGDERNITVSCDLNDKDAASMQALYAAFKAKTPIDMFFQIGTAALNTWVFQVKGVQLNATELDDSQRRFVRKYTNSRATGSAPGALDEIRLTIV
ncbi:MAG: hypothetical protein EPO02_13050 [Nitrospirae bacterium]|nr:MAG: hypothetical protein EPO02_13050 [Nitrospirota bacterium]